MKGTATSATFSVSEPRFPVIRKHLEGLSLEEKGLYVALCELAAYGEIVVRRGENVIALSAGQLAQSVRSLARICDKTKDWIARRLKKFISRGIINVAESDTHNATAPDIISVCHLRFFWHDIKTGATQDDTQSATQTRHERDTYKDKKIQREQEQESESDSCAKQAPHERVRGWKFPDLEETLRATSEPEPSRPSMAANPSPKPKRGAAKSPTGYSEAFEKFWSACPKRLGSPGSKPGVFAKWQKLSPEEQAEALAGAKRWAANEEAAGRVGTEYVPMIQTWFNGRRWLSEPEPVVKKQEERQWASMY